MKAIELQGHAVAAGGGGCRAGSGGTVGDGAGGDDQQHVVRHRYSSQTGLPKLQQSHIFHRVLKVQRELSYIRALNGALNDALNGALNGGSR